MYTEELVRKQNIFGGLFVLSNTLQTLMDRILVKVDLTSKQWLVLAVLGGPLKGESPTLKELAHTMGSTHQNIKQLVLKLEDKGFVALEKDEKDKRITRIRLKLQDGDLGEEFDRGALEFLETFFSKFTTEELIALEESFNKLQSTLGEIEAEMNN